MDDAESSDFRKADPAPDWRETLAAIIRSYGNPIPVDVVMSAASDLGSEYNRERDLVRELRPLFPQIRVNKVTGNISWSDEPAPEQTEATPQRPPLSDLARIWVNAEVEQREHLGAEAEASLKVAVTEPESVNFARAIGMVAGDPEWQFVSPTQCAETGALEGVLAKAPNWWCLEAAVILPSKQSTPALKRFKDLPQSEQDQIAFESLERWFSNETTGLSSRIGRLRSAIGSPTSKSLTASTLTLAVMLSQNEKSSGDVGALLPLITAAETTVLIAAINQASTDEIAALMRALATAKKVTTERTVLLTAIAQSERSQALFSGKAFAGLALDEIAKVLASDPFPQLLSNGLTEHIHSPIKAAMPTKLGLTLAAAATHPNIAELLPDDLVSQQFQHDEPSARLARKAAASVVEAAVENERAVQQVATADAKAKVEAAEARILLAEDARDAERRRADEAEHRLREALNSSREASASELRQARIDILRGIVDFAVQLGDQASAASPTSEIHSHLTHLEKLLADFEVSVIGRRGDFASYDPSMHEQANIEPGATVEIIRPAFLLSGTATPMRYGLVREVKTT